jgi:hypothetical protein
MMNGVNRKHTRGAALLFACALSGVAVAQSPAPAKPAVIRTDSTRATNSTTEQLDTGESITYLGKKLWFEVKRRMNLTTEAEEKQRRQEESNVRLKVGSIRVQAPGGAASKP